MPLPPPPSVEAEPCWVPRNWRRESIRVGPASFYGVEDTSATDVWAQGGSPLLVDAAIVVDAGATVRIEIPRSLRKTASLLWDPSKWKAGGRYEVGEGTAVARMAGCEDRPLSHQGGFLIAEPMCLRIRVVSASQTIRGRLPLGARC